MNNLWAFLWISPAYKKVSLGIFTGVKLVDYKAYSNLTLLGAYACTVVQFKPKSRPARYSVCVFLILVDIAKLFSKADLPIYLCTWELPLSHTFKWHSDVI